MKPKLDKKGYPLEWPVLEAGDFCRKTLCLGERRCLLGWKNMALCDLPYFPPNYTPQYESVSYYIAGFLLAAGKHLGTYRAHDSVADINDNRRNSLALLARIWNLAGAMAGYVVGNPEAKTLRKMKAA